jgi:hypothetical protein
VRNLQRVAAADWFALMRPGVLTGSRPLEPKHAADPIYPPWPAPHCVVRVKGHTPDKRDFECTAEQWKPQTNLAAVWMFHDLDVSWDVAADCTVTHWRPLVP